MLQQPQFQWITPSKQRVFREFSTEKCELCKSFEWCNVQLLVQIATLKHKINKLNCENFESDTKIFTIDEKYFQQINQMGL